MCALIMDAIFLTVIKNSCVSSDVLVIKCVLNVVKKSVVIKINTKMNVKQIHLPILEIEVVFCCDSWLVEFGFWKENLVLLIR